MKLIRRIKDLAVLAAVAAGGYALLNWESLNPATDESVAFAKRACTDSIERRYSARSVRPYKVEKSPTGYVVRASATLPRGASARVSCLANDHGGVEDLEILQY